jgi:hypothetical protein
MMKLNSAMILGLAALTLAAQAVLVPDAVAVKIAALNGAKFGFGCNQMPRSLAVFNTYDSEYYVFESSCGTSDGNFTNCTLIASGQVVVSAATAGGCTNSSYGTIVPVVNGFQWELLSLSVIYDLGFEIWNLDVNVTSSAVKFPGGVALAQSELDTACYSKIQGFDNVDLCTLEGCGTTVQPKSSCPIKYIAMIPPSSYDAVSKSFVTSDQNLRLSGVTDLSGLQDGCSTANRTTYPLFVKSTLLPYLTALGFDTSLIPANTTFPDFVKGYEFVSGSTFTKVNSALACSQPFPTHVPTAAPAPGTTPAPTTAAPTKANGAYSFSLSLIAILLGAFIQCFMN